MWLLQLKLITLSFSIASQAVTVSVCLVYFLLQMMDVERGGNRLCTEAELKAGGSHAGDSWYDGGPVTFDDE